MSKVYVVSLGRKYLYFQWIDPDTGKRVTRSSKCTTRREAERKAAALEQQLASERRADGSLAFSAFQDRYATFHVSTLSDTAESKVMGVLRSYERRMQPRSVGDLRTATLTDYAQKLRTDGLSQATVVSHLGVLHAALQWAKEQSLIAAVPAMPKMARSLSGRRMKGRSLTGAEFVRMLRAARAVVGREAARSWRHLLRGLWLSGLRLREALSLSWDSDAAMYIDAAGQFPMFRIRAESEKGFRDRVLPLTPDFAEFILRTPIGQRVGPVFRPIGDRGGVISSHYHASRIISAIGKGAGIIVDHRSQKVASAHDLRRSFGSRWARRVSPSVLMELMRHQAISTTMSYYVDLHGEQTASELWRSFGDRPTQQ